MRRAVKTLKNSEDYKAQSDEAKQTSIGEAKAGIKKKFAPDRGVRVIVESNDGKKAAGESFKELIDRQHMKDITPDSVRVAIKVCGLVIGIEFPSSDSSGFSLSSPRTKSSFLAILVGPRDATSNSEQQAGHFVDRVAAWADQYKQSRVQQVWNRLTPLQWYVLPFVYLILTALFPKKDGLDQVHAEARAILAEGVNDANQHRATEVLLRLVAKEPNTEVGLNVNGIVGWSLFGICVLVCIFLSFPPRNRIAIGKGVAAIKGRDRFYRYTYYPIRLLVFGAIPVAILGNLATDLIKRLFGF